MSSRSDSPNLGTSNVVRPEFLRNAWMLPLIGMLATATCVIIAHAASSGSMSMPIPVWDRQWTPSFLEQADQAASAAIWGACAMAMSMATLALCVLCVFCIGSCVAQLGRSQQAVFLGLAAATLPLAVFVWYLASTRGWVFGPRQIFGFRPMGLVLSSKAGPPAPTLSISVFEVMSLFGSLMTSVLYVFTLATVAVLYSMQSAALLSVRAFKEGKGKINELEEQASSLLNRLGRRMRFLQAMLILGAVSLVLCVVEVNALVDWAASYASADQAKGFARLGASFSAAMGACLTVALCVLYLPAAFVVRETAAWTLTEMGTSGAPELEEKLGAYGLGGVTWVGGSLRVLAALAPLVAGVIGPQVTEAIQKIVA